jgi:hypothetical protein
MLTAIGKLKYDPVGITPVEFYRTEEFRLTVEVDEDFGRYYRRLIPKSYPTQKPRWPPHITVVRAGKEKPTEPFFWGLHEGSEVEFSYDPVLRLDKVYYWLSVWSPQLSEIRKELGLPPKSRWTRPPDAQECFHITIANRKGPA